MRLPGGASYSQVGGVPSSGSRHRLVCSVGDAPNGRADAPRGDREPVTTGFGDGGPTASLQPLPVGPAAHLPPSWLLQHEAFAVAEPKREVTRHTDSRLPRCSSAWWNQSAGSA
jgi:hypothetical protein